jgi:hypothetical protein
LNALPDNVCLENVDVWFQDETRIGQQGSTSRMWAKRGTRPRALKQQQFVYSYIYGAICPSTGQAVGLMLPKANTACMALHMDEISRSIPEGRHALIMMDGAGWHQDFHARSNISLLKIPPYSPELNPCEQVWQYIKDKWLKNRCYKDYGDILTAGCEAWESFTAEEGRVQSLCSRRWAVI